MKVYLVFFNLRASSQLPAARNPKPAPKAGEEASGTLQCSENPLGLSVDFLESICRALLENDLGGEALIFIVVVCVHAVSEQLHLVLAELVQDGLAG